MIYDIPKPEISPSFTIEDIHKIREWNYERTKDATFAESSRHFFNLAAELNTVMSAEAYEQNCFEFDVYQK
jgi:hypothetical protein